MLQLLFRVVFTERKMHLLQRQEVQSMYEEDMVGRSGNLDPFLFYSQLPVGAMSRSGSNTTQKAFSLFLLVWEGLVPC